MSRSRPPLRPLDFGQILDAAFQLYRRHFSSMFLTALVPYLPLLTLSLVVMLFSVLDSTLGTVLLGVTALATLPLMLAGFIVAWGAITFQAGRAYMGEPVSLADALSRGVSRFFPLLGAVILAGVLTALGFVALIVPGLVAIAAFFAVMPAVMIEGRGPLEALGRSRDLSRGDRLRILGIVIVAGIIAAIPSWGVAVVQGAMAVTSGGEVSPVTSFSLTLVGQVMQALTLPFSMAATVILYYDRRVRAEALDVQMAAKVVVA